jgi:hydroxymethylglutaryl-CoA synthase
MKTGIDGIGYSVPKLAIPIDGRWSLERANVFSNGDVAALRSKITNGIGIMEMSIPDSHEDVVTLAAGAMRDLLERRGISLNEISHVLFASEGGVDCSKSASSYALGLIADYFGADASHIANVELKFACAASSYAIEYAQALLRAGMCSRKYVIVVASDIARYELGTSGEYTQGAGAVALALCQDPTLIELDEGPMAAASSDERDFFRPLFRPFPTFDGKYSVEVYLSLVERAFGRYSKVMCERRKSSVRDVVGQAGGLLFHVPFPKMAEYIASRLLLPHFENVERLSPEHRAEAEKSFRKTPAFIEMFADKIEPSLALARRVGNIYSGSLPLALAGFLLQPEARLSSLGGKSLLFFGYGSGATARVYSGTLLPSPDKSALPRPLSSFGRQEVSFEDYEILHAQSEIRQEQSGNAVVVPLGPSVLKPRDEFVYLGMKAQPVSELGLRLYKYQA